MEIYVHIPFCERKCDYCDFVSFSCSEETHARYFAKLKEEIINRRETVGALPVVSCFFGGGTPSVPKASYITDILKLLKEQFPFEADAEITIEVNPHSGSKEKLLAYKKAGFNRVSIGLQSADDMELRVLSRLHNYEQFLETYNAAREAGFDNINIDLMSAIPTQTMESYKRTLEKVIALRPEHISAYSLILEEGTLFFERYRDAHDLPDEDTEREMYYMTKDVLKKAGYERYEISNYSLKGYECRHNLGYWRRVPYLGFGIAAAGLLNETRYQMHSDLKRYLEGDFSTEEEILSKEDIMSEFMFLGLRCVAGIEKKKFEECFGTDIYSVYKEEIEKLKKEGLLDDSGNVLLTDKGMDLANYCMTCFLK